MSFTSILESIVHACSGSVGVALMGNDGIPIEQVLGSSPEARALEEAQSAAGVEFGHVIDEAAKVAHSLGGGALRELVVTLERFTLLFEVVDEESFLVLVLLPDGNLGKARYLMRRNLLAIREEL